jgi:hypothetical protein
LKILPPTLLEWFRIIANGYLPIALFREYYIPHFIL